MIIAGNRWLTIALDLLIALTAGIILYVFLVGGITIQVGGAVPGLGRAKLTCNKLVNPSLFLLLLLLLRTIISRPAPISRLRRWCTNNTRTILLAVLVTLVASIPRLWRLDGHSLEPDELLWIGNGQELISHVRVHEFKKATAPLVHPGVAPSVIIGVSYCYLGKGTTTYSWGFMNPVVAARMPVALLGIATCLLLYLLARVALGDATAFWGAIFLSLYQEQIGTSRVAQLDSTLTSFCTISILCYLMYMQGKRLRWHIASAVFFGLALLTKTPAYILPCIIFVWKALVRLYKRSGKFHFWESSDLGWLGLGLAIYLSLFTKLWYSPNELEWVKYVRFLPQVAVLIKMVTVIARFPWLQCAALTFCVYVLFNKEQGGRGEWRNVHPLPWGTFLVLLLLAFIQVFQRPIINELLHAAAVHRFGDAGHLKYWMGKVILSPPYWFYLFMLLICTTPAVLFFVICGIVRSCGVLYRRETGWESSLMCLVAPFTFIAAMSMGNKMAIRYIDPVIPFICLLSGIGLVGIINAIADIGILERAQRARGILYGVAGVMVVVSCILPLVRIAPDYAIYRNFLIGGPLGASRLISIGFGVGIKEAVQYLKSRVKSGDSIYVVGLHGEFRYYWDHEGPGPACGVRINQTSPPHVDWLVIPLGHRMRGLADKELRLTPRRTKVHAVTKCGIDFLDIYRVEDMPVGESAL